MAQILVIFQCALWSSQRAISVACLLLGLCINQSFAQVIAIEPVRSSSLGSTEPIMTMYYRGNSPKLLVIYLSGGWGKIGLRSSTSAMIDPFSKMLIALTNPKLTSGKLDLVFMDSPNELHWMSQRDSADHLSRIMAVVQFYKKKTGLPIWLMGHSNGSLSLASFVGYLQQSNQIGAIDGLILSAPRNETQFSSPLTMPMLFLHHEEDGCVNTQPKFSLELYKKLIGFDKANLKYEPIVSGEYEINDPCTSGYHMYFNAEQEVLSAVQRYFASFMK